MKTGVYRYENKEYEWYYIEESDISKLKAFCYGFVRGEDLSRFATKLEKKTCSAVTMQGNSAFRIREMRMSVEKACIPMPLIIILRIILPGNNNGRLHNRLKG